MLDTIAVEIEAKMRLTDLAALEARLQELGAQRGPLLLELNTYFDTPRHRLRAADEGLRIRIATDLQTDQQTIVITHKGPRAHGRLKSRAETEVAVDDALTAGQMLLALGYQPVLTFEKRRQRWRLDDCHVEIDTLPHIGQFIEIEGPGDEEIFAARSRLQLDDSPIVHASYMSLLTSYLSEHHLSLTRVMFDE